MWTVRHEKSFEWLARWNVRWSFLLLGLFLVPVLSVPLGFLLSASVPVALPVAAAVILYAGLLGFVVSGCKAESAIKGNFEREFLKRRVCTPAGKKGVVVKAWISGGEPTLEVDLESGGLGRYDARHLAAA